MKYRRLGKTGLNVSVIGVGTWQLGGEWGKQFTVDEVRAMLHRARELGINLIDTAECYGDHVSESLIGQAIEGQRQGWIIATKFGHKYEGFLNRSEPRSARDVERQLEDSLRALRTDFIDVYQYHSVRNHEYDDPEVRAVLDKALKAGKVRHLGASISPPDNLHQTDGAVAVIQVLYNRLDRRAEAAVLPRCKELDLGVFARVPLASGFLSGKYNPRSTFKEGDVRSVQDRAKIEAQLREVEEIRRAEVPPDVNMAQWALAWCLKNPAVTAVIPGAKSVEQVESNAKAAELVS